MNQKRFEVLNPVQSTTEKKDNDGILIKLARSTAKASESWLRGPSLQSPDRRFNKAGVEHKARTLVAFGTASDAYLREKTIWRKCGADIMGPPCLANSEHLGPPSDDKHGWHFHFKHVRGGCWALVWRFNFCPYFLLIAAVCHELGTDCRFHSFPRETVAICLWWSRGDVLDAVSYRRGEKNPQQGFQNCLWQQQYCKIELTRLSPVTAKPHLFPKLIKKKIFLCRSCLSGWGVI